GGHTYQAIGFSQVAGDDDYQGSNAWTTMDIDGDGKPDLVVSAKGGLQFGEPGARFWNVYMNTGSGFASTPTKWCTPDGGHTYQAIGFSQVAGDDDYQGSNAWTTMDIDGDGKPDLVVSAKGGLQFGEAGARFWNIYGNTGNGFADTPKKWWTPDGGHTYQ